MSAVKIQVLQDVAIVAFVDSKIVDSQRIEMIGSELQGAIPQAIHKKMLLDFDGVAFMSSAMLTKLVLLHKACKTKGIDLKLCSITPNVMEVFKITKLNKLFDIQSTLEKALKSFS